MIVANALTFQYGGSAPLFVDLDLSIPEAGFYSIFGRSGCGKSTLAKLIAGRLTGSARSVVNAPAPTLYSSSDDALPHWSSVSRHLRDFTPKDHQSVLTAFCAAANLPPELNNRYPDELSLGQRQRFNVARYIALAPPGLILDEALIGVDQPTRWSILEWIKAERNGRTTILVSHEIEDVVLFSKTIIRLSSDAPARIALVTGMDLDLAQKGFDARRYQEIRTTLLAP